jgi:hypothetical protein
MKQKLLSERYKAVTNIKGFYLATSEWLGVTTMAFRDSGKHLYPKTRLHGIKGPNIATCTF